MRIPTSSSREVIFILELMVTQNTKEQPQHWGLPSTNFDEHNFKFQWKIYFKVIKNLKLLRGKVIVLSNILKDIV